MNQKNELIARRAQALELDKLTELLEELHDETGEIDTGALTYYIGGRREQLASRITALKASPTTPSEGGTR